MCSVFSPNIRLRNRTLNMHVVHKPRLRSGNSQAIPPILKQKIPSITDTNITNCKLTNFKIQTTNCKLKGHKSQLLHTAWRYVGISWHNAPVSCLCIILRNIYRSLSAYTLASMSNSECKGELNLTRVSSDLHVIQLDVAAYCRDLGLQGKYIPVVHRVYALVFLFMKNEFVCRSPRYSFQHTCLATMNINASSFVPRVYNEVNNITSQGLLRVIRQPGSLIHGAKRYHCRRRNIRKAMRPQLYKHMQAKSTSRSL